MTERKRFEGWAKRCRKWHVFDDSDFRICSRDCPAAGEYANQNLQQFWECWQAARRHK